MKDVSNNKFLIHHSKTVTQNNTQIHLIIISYTNTNEQKIPISKANILTNDSEKKDMRIEIAMNGHLENCICEKCHQAREMLKALRNF